MTRTILSRPSGNKSLENRGGLLFAFAGRLVFRGRFCGVEKVFRFLMRLLRKLKRFGRKFHGLFGMLVPGQVIFLIVMRPRGQVRVRGEIVKFSGALVPIVTARPVTRASAAFIAALFAHKLSLSRMSEKCITRLFGRVYCSSPAIDSSSAGLSLRGFVPGRTKFRRLKPASLKCADSKDNGFRLDMR
jgi:hypothetical protein